MLVPGQMLLGVLLGFARQNSPVPSGALWSPSVGALGLASLASLGVGNA